MDTTTVVKPKKFALPRFYMRVTRGIDTTTEITDELNVEGYSLTNHASSSTSSIPDVENTVADNTDKGEVLQTKNVKGKEAKSKTTKVKNPSAYNLFIKETCETLAKTRANLTARERYALAIQMWNDRKTAGS